MARDQRAIAKSCGPLLTVAITMMGSVANAWADDAPRVPLPAASAHARDVASRPAARTTAIALQGGWWSLEAEWRSRPGVYVAAGIPWAIVPVSLMSGASWVVPLGARVGYQHPLSERWSLRGSLHGAVAFDDETSKCGCQSEMMQTRSFAFAELGARYESPDGFLAGVDLPLFALRFPRKAFAPPASLAFGQAYVGFSWGL